jgi:ABC-2 type transport system permease protein
MNALTTSFAIARMSWLRQHAYRAANVAGLITNVFFGFLRASVLVALFAARGEPEVSGYSLRDAITYTGLTQALIVWVALWGWWDLIRAIKTGDIASDLQRPVQLFWYWCAQDAGRALSQFATRSLPIMLIYAVLFRIALPHSADQWLGFGLSMLLAWLCSFAWRFLYSLAGFWTTDAIGVGRAASFLVTFMSGFLMPVAFFPPWAQTLMRLTPFPSFVNTPTEIFVNVATGPRMLELLAAQAFWAAAMIAIAHLVLAAGVRRLTMQGG